VKRRRSLVGLIPWPALAAPSAQAQAKLPRVVLILTGDAAGTAAFSTAFAEGMRQAGQVEGRTWRFDVRLGEGEPARSAQHLKQAVASRADVLVVGGLILARQALEATSTIPVVVATGGNLVEAGLVKSLARPGGNLTGISDLADEATLKRLELTRVALPKAARLALLSNPEFPATVRVEARVESAARQLGFAIVRAQATDRASMVRAIDGLRTAAPDVLLVIGDALHTSNRRELIERASAARLPVVFYWPDAAEMGALISYHPDVADNFKRAAGYVDRILRGERPAELPIQQPTRYELVVNLRVAQRLGIRLPPEFLLRADRVIE
jgi:putative tryptophan/tyrosine transport system substrate-binding protein